MPEPEPKSDDKPQVITETAPLGSTVCPCCRGWKWIDCRSVSFLFFFFIAFPASILALAFTRPFYRCDNCGYELNHTAGRPQTIIDWPHGAMRMLLLAIAWVFVAVAIKACHDAQTLP